MSHEFEIVELNNMKVLFPSPEDKLDQDEEWCKVVNGTDERKIRFHDYNEIYEIPGLYETIFYNQLKCQSPEYVCGKLKDRIQKENFVAKGAKALDVGAGNGMVGECLRSIGFSVIYGIDIIEEAKTAALRDRPDVYDEYFISDLTQLPSSVEKELEQQEFDCMTTVAALGYDDIPPAAFSAAYNLVKDDGLIAFNIKDRFLDANDPSGFQLLIREMDKKGIMDIDISERYPHRYGIDGEPLYYVAIVGKKNQNVSDELLELVEERQVA